MIFSPSSSLIVPKCLFIIIKINDYDYNNSFFYMVIQINIIILYIHKSGYNTICVFEI